MRDRKRRAANRVVLALFVLTALVGCAGPASTSDSTPVYAPGGASDSSSVGGSDQGTGQGTGQTGQTVDQVSGALDASRHVPLRTALASRPHMVRECHPVTRRVRRTTGFGKSKTTTYTTVTSTECDSVPQGTETYRRVVSAERWCVEIDNVNGHTDQDQRWYRVTPDIYQQAQGQRHGSQIDFQPTGDGC